MAGYHSITGIVQNISEGLGSWDSLTTTLYSTVYPGQGSGSLDSWVTTAVLVKCTHMRFKELGQLDNHCCTGALQCIQVRNQRAEIAELIQLYSIRQEKVPF